MSTEPSRYFEDLEPGETHDIGSYVIDEAEMIAFAERYDPQPFHVDREAAADSAFGGLIGSGLLTACISNVLTTETFYGDLALVGGSGMEISFDAPVYPGDRLEGGATVVAKRPLESRPEWGLIRLREELTNQRDEDVFSMEVVSFVERRDPLDEQ